MNTALQTYVLRKDTTGLQKWVESFGDKFHEVFDFDDHGGDASMFLDGTILDRGDVIIHYNGDYFLNKMEISTPSGEAEDFTAKLLKDIDVYLSQFTFYQGRMEQLNSIGAGSKLHQDVRKAREMSLNQHKAEGVVHSDFINFRDDLQVGVDRILRDKGMSNIDIWEAINATLETIREKYQIQRPNSSPIDPIKAREIAQHGYEQGCGMQAAFMSRAKFQDLQAYLNRNHPLPDNTDNQEKQST